MQAVQSSLNDRISSIISQRRTYRNTIASRIYTIPLEIFTRILLESIEEVEWDLERLHALACVSKYWSSIVLSTPQLWTVVRYETGQYSSDPPHLWKIALKRSMQLPISCQIHARERGMLSEKDSLALERISAESHRWRSMDFKGFIPPKVIRFLASPCPNLESLSLKPSGHLALTDLEIPFGEHLHSIWLNCISLRWDECMLHDLRTLSLHMNRGWEADGGPSWQQILAILSRSPRLEVLELVNPHMFGESSTLSPEVAQQIAHMGRIILSCLRTLKIVGISLAISFSILAKVHAPCVDDFSWEREGEDLTEWLFLLRSGPSRIVPGHVVSSITSGDVAVKLGLSSGGYCEIDIIASGEDKEGGFRRLLTKLQPDASDLEDIFDLFMIGSVIATLSLTVFSYENGDSFSPLLLDNLPMLRELKLIKICNTVEILSHLSNRFGPGQRWPCPMMTHLTIIMSNLPPEALVSFKSTRYPDQSTSSTMDIGDGKMGLPVPLESLVVRNLASTGWIE
ncbi:hypothetical protein FRB95_001116 [Tulasnella sp. JGI-2019a]|nr:hypothetical protein FRB95_001116 [Tulasnella sp. JGI-2019a]